MKDPKKREVDLRRQASAYGRVAGHPRPVQDERELKRKAIQLIKSNSSERKYNGKLPKRQRHQ